MSSMHFNTAYISTVLQHFNTMFLVSDSPLQETLYLPFCVDFHYFFSLLICLPAYVCPVALGLTYTYVYEEGTQDETHDRITCVMERQKDWSFARKGRLVGQENSVLTLVKFSWTND